jgi:valyl-tRNA synthetase
MAYLIKLAKVKNIEIGKDVQSPKNAATSIKSSMEIFVPLQGLIDVNVEMERLNKEVNKTEKELIFVKKKLANRDFISKAPEKVVEDNKYKSEILVDKLQVINRNINKLKRMSEPDEE